MISETWIGQKTVGGLAGRQRIRVVETDFKYPMLRLEEDVTIDPKSGLEISEIRRSSVADHLLVGLRKNLGSDDLQQQLEESGFKVRSIEEDSFLLVEIPAFEKADDLAAAAARLAELDEFINFAEPDWIVHTTSTPDDPAFSSGKAWSFDNPGTVAGTLWDADIDGPDGWGQQTDASSVVVAVTDTGIRYTHEDLADNMWSNVEGHHGFDAYDEDTDPMDTNGHGTHVAGIIGARGNNGLGTSGVAWNVRLMALRFIGPNGGTTSDAIRVLNYARLNGANIINASWGGGGFSQGLLEAIMACYAADIAVVAAAGNLTRDNDTIPHYPSGYEPPNIISVASSDASDHLSFFSNYGNTFVDLAAPGTDIWSCGIDSDSDYRHLSGTSMAAPHVAGALALAKARYPSETFVDLIARLNTSVDTRPALTRKVATGGRLNLYRLLADSLPSYPHDDFEKPYWFFGCYGYWCYSNARMTREPDEDSFSPGTGNKSMWFRWTAPSDGLVRFKGEGTIGDISVVAFEGVDRNSLKRMADNFKQRPTKSSFLYFYAKAGRTYSFSIDSRLASPQIVIGELVHHPVNDMWRDATNLATGNRIETNGNNCGATAESWEHAAPHAGSGNGRSVWWRWTPDFTGEFTLTTQGSSFDTVLAVYTGNDPGQLTEIASNDDRSQVDWTSEVSFQAVQGTTYYIVVDSYRGTSYGDITLNGYVPGDLFIINQPNDTLVRVGDFALLQVAAAGFGLRYQWEFEGIPIPGAVLPHYQILRVTGEHFGTYRVRVSDIAQTIISNEIELSELGLSPQIIWQSRNQSLAEGSNHELRVRATGTGTLNYQWFKNDVAMPGANSDTLALGNVGAGDEATYVLRIGNATGFTETDPIAIRVFSSPWNAWSYADPNSQAGTVVSIVKQNDQWVAAARVLNAVRISTSTDGRNWNHRFIKPEGSVYDIIALELIHGNGKWMCLCQASGTLNGAVYLSSDLENWQQQVLPLSPVTSQSAQDVEYHDGFFYLTASSFLFRSPDGINWTQQFAPDSSRIRGQGFQKHGTSLITGQSGRQIAVLQGSSSPWQIIDIDPSSGSTLESMYWNQGLFHAYLGNTKYQSADGITWVMSPTPVPLDGMRRNNWTASIGSTVLSWSAAYNKTYVSHDNGITWSGSYANLLPSDASIAAGDGNLIIFGTTRGGLLATTDPLQPDFQSTLGTNSFVALGYEGGQFIAQYYDRLLLSSDGQSWTSHKTRDMDTTNNAPAIASRLMWIDDEYWQSGASVFGGNGRSYYRGRFPGAVRERRIPGLPNGHVSALTHGPAGVLAALIQQNSDFGYLARTLDGGETWVPVTAPGGSVSKYATLTFRGSHYFYTAYFGNTYASSDLETWIDLGHAATGIVFHQGEYWVYNMQQLRRSADLVNWSAIQSQSLPSTSASVVYNGALVGIGSGKVSYSFDGINWVKMELGFTARAVATSGSMLVVAGSNGEIAYTGNPPQTSPSVRITSPLEDATWVIGAPIIVKVDAYSPAQAGNPTVRLFYDNQEVATDSSPPYEFSLPAGAAGKHLVHVECWNGSSPVALDRKFISVAELKNLNMLSGIVGSPSLPGIVQYIDGTYFSGTARSNNAIDWQPIAIPATTGNIQYLVQGDSKLIAYHGGTLTSVSLDGLNWFTNILPATPTTKIQFSGNQFWAMASLSGSTGATGLIKSADGINWNYEAMVLAPGSLTEVAGNPDGIMIGRTSSAVWRSANGGRSWQQMDGYAFPSHLHFDGTRFYLKDGGTNTTRRIGSSIDGINWTWSDPGSGYASLKIVNGTLFSGNTQGAAVHVSYDGVDWSDISSTVTADTIVWNDDGYFYGKGQAAGTGASSLMRSHNGRNWVAWTPWPTTEQVTLLSSPDGLHATSTGGALWFLASKSKQWTQRFHTKTFAPQINDFDVHNNTVIAINDRKTLIKSSDLGRTWETIYNPGTLIANQHSLSRVFFRNGVWLVWSPNTQLLRSVDGQTFTDITSSVQPGRFSAMAKNDSVFAAARVDGGFETSTDGLIWSQVAPAGSFPDANAIHLVWQAPNWRALSLAGTGTPRPLKLSTSPDAVNWVQSTVGSTSSTGGGAIATTSAGTIAGLFGNMRFSADELTWVNSFTDTTTVAYQDRFYKAQTGWLEYSDDGLTWVKQENFGITGSVFSRLRVLDGALYLFGQGSFTKIFQEDIAVSNVTAPAGNYGVGDSIPVSFALSNAGTGIIPSGTLELEFFLTADGFRGNRDDTRLGTASLGIPAIPSGQTIQLQANALIPNSILPGSYRVGMIANPAGLNQEANSGNNLAISLPIAINIPGWLLRATPLGEGSIAQDIGQQQLFAHGSRVSLTASAAKGARFTGWAGDALGTESQVTILMTQNRNVQATFASQIALQILVNGAGSVSGAGDQGLFLGGQTASLVAEPSAGWQFANWSGAATGTSPDTSILMDTPKTVIANFILPMQAWKERYFTSGELSNRLVSGDEADHDRDGLENWKEYLHGSHPRDPSSNGVLQKNMDGGYLTLIYTRLAGPQGSYSLSCEGTRNLSFWDTGEIQERVLRVADGIETVEIRMIQTGHPSGFVRFKYHK